MQQQNNVALHLIVKKLSLIFYCVFKVFMFLNIFLLGLTLYVMLISKSGIGIFLFIIFFINFWIMLIFFCLLSMYIKLFICMIHDDLLSLDENQSWIFSVIFFPLVSEENEDDFIQLVSQQSFENEERNVQAPNGERLNELETTWKTIWKELSIPEEKQQEPCLICANAYSHEYPSHQGCIKLECCSILLHKKCVLEWFHFNEKQEDDSSKKNVSCPSCRNLFTT